MFFFVFDLLVLNFDVHGGSILYLLSHHPIGLDLGLRLRHQEGFGPLDFGELLR